MYREFVRQMKVSERKLLGDALLADTNPRDRRRDTLKWLAVGMGGLILCAVPVIAASHLIPEGVVRGGWQRVAVMACALTIAVFSLAGLICFYVMTQVIRSHFEVNRLRSEFRRETAPEIRNALADGQVIVKEVAATAVIELAEYEDEGSGWLFDIGAGQVLFLKGQSYEPEDESLPWPNSEFEIVRTRHGKMWVGIFCHGEELEPVRVLELSDCRHEIAWKDGEELLAGEINSVADSLLDKAT